MSQQVLTVSDHWKSFVDVAKIEKSTFISTFFLKKKNSFYCHSKKEILQLLLCNRSCCHWILCHPRVQRFEVRNFIYV